MAALALQATLKRMGRWIVMTGGACGVGWGLLATGVFLTVMVWLDLMWELPASARITALFAAVVAGLVLLAISVRRALGTAPATALARHLDRVAGTGGEILAGVEMSPGGEGALRVGGSPLSAGLAEIAVERAARLASGLSRQEVAPLRPVKRSFGAALGFAVFVGVLLLAMPRLARTEWLRFADPFGDHPPYSRIHFEVTPAGARVLYGGGLEILARTEGAGVDKVELVLLPVEGSGAGETLPMFPESDGVWRASISSIVKPAKYFVRSRGSRSYKYALDVTMVPKIEEVRFRVTPPAYTRQTPYEGELPPAGLSGLPGTKVEVTARSNRPLSGGKLAIIAGAQTQEFPVASLPNDNHQAAGSFVIEKSGRLELKLIDTDGAESTENFSAPVVRLADEHPFVRLVEPRPMSLAVPNAVLPVVVGAEDDYGLSRVQLFRSLNDSRPIPLDVTLPTFPPRQVFETVPLPLSSYGLEPGDEIKLFARVEDNDPGYPPAKSTPPGAPRQPGKGAESAVVVIRIISQAEFDRLQVTRDGLETLMAKYQQAERRMESLLNELDQLKQELDKLKSDDPKQAEELRQKMQKLAQRIKEEADELRKLSQTRQPFKVDEQLSRELAKAADALERLSKQMQEDLKDPAKREQLQKQIEELKKKLQEQKEHLDQETMRPLQRLQQVFPLMEAEARFGQLARRQRDLAERLKSLDGKDQKDDPTLKARMRDLEAEQRKLREQLQQLADDIEERAQALPDNDPQLNELKSSALEFAKALRESGAGEAMADAEQGLSDFSGTRGHAGAKKAADLLEKLMAKAEGMGMGGAGGRSLRFQPGLGNSLGETMRQLLEGMGMQPGMGTGSGEGFTSSRDTMQNVGLYGQMPQKESSSGGGKKDNKDAKGGMTRAVKPKSGSEDGSGYEAGQTGTASGTGEVPVPLRYRQRNSRYFQRLADELRDR